MAIVRLEPFGLLQQYFNDVNKLLGTHSLINRDDSHASTSQWLPLVDIKEEDDRYLVKADLPGIKPEDIEVSMENKTLTIKGSRENETKDEKDNYVRIERVSGSFYRQFTLPESADANQISANYKAGVLEISIPKREPAKSRKIEIQS